MIEACDIFGGLIFIAGSICFHPIYAEDLPIFLCGCGLYVVGSAIYFAICLFTLMEALRQRGIRSWEACENILYAVGSLIFVIGTILYWPQEAHHKHMNWVVQHMSLGMYFNLFSPEFEGTILFIVGSMMFSFAAFVNGLNQRTFESRINQMLTAVTSLYMMGSLLFCMGSIAFLPDLGCNETMVAIGAWCFIVGSIFYTVGSIVSLVRTDLILRRKENEPLVLCDADPERH